MKKNNVKKTDETPEEYFMGMLLAASENDLNKIEIADVWDQAHGKVDLYYRTKNFDNAWNFKKAKRIPFRFYDMYYDVLDKVKGIMKARGISVPAIDFKCIDIRKDGNLL